MIGRSVPSRSENLGQNVLAIMKILCFTFFVVGIFVLTIITANSQPEDPLFHPITEITTFLTSTSDATFHVDEPVLNSGEDFITSSKLASAEEVNLTEVNAPSVVNPDCDEKMGNPVDCRDPEIFHLMMRAAIERFDDIHFYRFGKPIRGSNDSTCDMAWRYRPKEGRAVAFSKDYRRFVIFKSQDCSFYVGGIGDYHTGVNARKRTKKNQFESKVTADGQGDVNGTLPAVKSEKNFRSRRYLIYSQGGGKCMKMTHYLWNFLCALGEAQYLNRTLVMDLRICLYSIYTSSKQNEEGKDFRFYFDFEHLKESAPVLDHNQFWSDWSRWHRKDGLNLYVPKDFRTTPMELASVNDALIMRKFRPDYYWHKVCEGEASTMIRRPWHLMRKSKRLMGIVSGIAARLSWDFDTIHVGRGTKVDVMLKVLQSTLKDEIQVGRHVYIATSELNTSFLDSLKERYKIFFLNDYRDLWDENSEWYADTKELTKGFPVEFDGYMRTSVNLEVFLRGKKQIEAFNDRMSDRHVPT